MLPQIAPERLQVLLVCLLGDLEGFEQVASLRRVVPVSLEFRDQNALPLDMPSTLGDMRLGFRDVPELPFSIHPLSLATTRP